MESLETEKVILVAPQKVVPTAEVFNCQVESFGKLSQGKFMAAVRIEHTKNTTRTKGHPRATVYFDEVT